MKERPIILKAHEVRGILDGSQTQLRRIMKEQPPIYEQHTVSPQEKRGEPKKHPKPYFDAYNHGPFWCWWDEYDRQGDGWVKCPFGQVGDCLWVKEAARCTRYSAQHLQNRAEIDTEYKAGGAWGVRGTISFIDGLRQFPQCSHNADGQMRWASPLEMPRWASRILLEIVSVRVERLQERSLDDCFEEGFKTYESWSKNPWMWVIELKRVDA